MKLSLFSSLALAAAVALSNSTAFAQSPPPESGRLTAGSSKRGDSTGAGTATPRTTPTAATAPKSGRPRDGRKPEGTAVPREGTRPAPTDAKGGSVLVPLGYGAGVGGYYGGYYDPYGGSGPNVPPPPPPPPPAPRAPAGAIKLKITPKQAFVFVDGGFAGVVDDFDGVFQKLTLEAGPHRIEVQAEGYEPLVFDVNITPDDTITYRGELKKIP
jgi:hypothetical protein